jgi:hypothetical protein
MELHNSSAFDDEMTIVLASHASRKYADPYILPVRQLRGVRVNRGSAAPRPIVDIAVGRRAVQGGGQ